MLETLSRPLIQAPMAGSSGVALAIAVARAGGLGSLPCAMRSIGQITDDVAEFRETIDAPVNLNFFCHEDLPLTVEASRRWRQKLNPYFEELHAEDSSSAPARQPFRDASVELVEALKPEVVSFHFGLPEDSLMARVKQAGSFVLSSATTAEEARWLTERGADGIIAQGIEAGGHRGHFLRNDLEGQAPLLELLPMIMDKTDLPVIAAGGIGSRERVDACLSAGAAAVQVGTAFLLCPEARTSPVHRAALSDPTIEETAITNLFSGRPARGLVNRIMRELGPMNDDAPPFPHAGATLTPLRKAAEINGSGDFSPLWSGTDRTGCQAVSATEIVRQLFAD